LRHKDLPCLLLIFDSREDLYEKFKNKGVKLCAGMRNAKLGHMDIGSGDSAFLDVSIKAVLTIPGFSQNHSDAGAC